MDAVYPGNRMCKPAPVLSRAQRNAHRVTRRIITFERALISGTDKRSGAALQRWRFRNA